MLPRECQPRRACRDCGPMAVEWGERLWSKAWRAGYEVGGDGLPAESWPQWSCRDCRPMAVEWAHDLWSKAWMAGYAEAGEAKATLPQGCKEWCQRRWREAWSDGAMFGRNVVPLMGTERLEREAWEAGFRAGYEKAAETYRSKARQEGSREKDVRDVQAAPEGAEEGRADGAGGGRAA